MRIRRRALMKESAVLAAGLAFTPKTQSGAGGGALRPLFDRYFEAWHGSDPERVLAYFSDDVFINLWGDGSTLKGKKAVGDQWITPTMKRCPGNVHHVRNFLEVGDQVVIEWLFTGVDVSTHKEESDPGCSVYWVKDGLITRGHLYFNAG